MGKGGFTDGEGNFYRGTGGSRESHGTQGYFEGYRCLSLKVICDMEVERKETCCHPDPAACLSKGCRKMWCTDECLSSCLSSGQCPCVHRASLGSAVDSADNPV